MRSGFTRVSKSVPAGYRGEHQGHGKSSGIFSKFFDRWRRPIPGPSGSSGPPPTVFRGSTRGTENRVGFFLSFSTVGGDLSPDPRGARVRLQRCSGGVPGARNFDRWRRPLPGPSGRGGSPPTVRSGCTRFSKRVSARNRKPSFRKRRPPGGGPDQPQDSCPTLGGPRPGRLRRHTPVRTLVLFRQPHTDRLANVTRHRRAPAGQPRAGVWADGSSGLRVRLHRPGRA